MSYSKTSWEAHIQSELEPDQILRGNAKRFHQEKGFVAKNKAMQQLRDEMGEDKYYEMLQELQERNERLKEYLD